VSGEDVLGEAAGIVEDDIVGIVDDEVVVGGDKVLFESVFDGAAFADGLARIVAVTDGDSVFGAIAEEGLDGVGAVIYKGDEVLDASLLVSA